MKNNRNDVLSCFADPVMAGYMSEDRSYPIAGSTEYCRILIDRAVHYTKTIGRQRAWRRPALYSDPVNQNTLNSLSRLQLKIFADDNTKNPMVQIAAAINFFSDIGGDFYTIYNLPGKKIGVVIADVCGKDSHAAAYVPIIQGMLRHEMIRGASAGQILTALNIALHQILPDDRFVTVFLGIYDTHSKNLEFANAGHPAGVLIHPDGRYFTLDSTGPGLGMLTDICFVTGNISITPAEILVLYTDGYPVDTEVVKSIIERNLVRPVISKKRYRSANDIVRIFQTHMQYYVHPEYPNDDRTIVILQFFGI